MLDVDNGAVLTGALEHASTSAHKARGLLGRGEYPEGNALLLEGCSSIHMFFMKFPIDVLFVDDRLQVLRIVEGLRPWRWASCPRAHATVELPALTVRRLGIEVGHRLEIRK